MTRPVQLCQPPEATAVVAMPAEDSGLEALEGAAAEEAASEVMWPVVTVVMAAWTVV